jgi:hypothetical protein
VVAALAFTLFACGDGSKTSNEKREVAPVPVPESPPRDEPAKNDPYAKDEPAKDTAPNADPLTQAPKEPAPDAMPKTPSTGDPPMPPAVDDTAHKEFQDAVDARLKKVDEQMTALAAKVKDASEDAKAALQKSFDDLSQKRDEAATKLDEIRAIAADKWDAAKATLEKSVSELETAVAEALK